MGIIGFNFNKILVERKKMVGGKINISNNVSIRNVEEADLPIKNKDAVLKFNYTFSSKYDPEIGVIEIEGDVLFLEKEEIIQEILKNWKKDRKIQRDVMSIILNAVLNKCNIEALILSRDMNLPAPIPLPKVSDERRETNPSKETKEPEKKQETKPKKK